MKIYTRCVYAWQPDGSLKLEESDSFDYEGPIALCKDAPSHPPAPDYVGAANAQGAANLTSAQQGAVLSNPNINSPYGNQQVSYAALGGDNPATANFLSPTINQSLNPQSQQIFNAQQATKLGLANLGQQGLSTAQNVMGTPFKFSGPDIQTSMGNYGTAGANVPAGQGMAATPDLFGFGSAQRNLSTPSVQTGLNTSNVAAMPINAGNTGYQAIMSRLDPQLTQQRNMEETRLRNQGLVAGGEAYDAARRDLDQSQNDALLQAASQAVGLDLTANQQGYNQALQSGQFANQAAGQQFGQNLQAGQFGNQALAQNQQAALEQQQAQNTAQQQQFGQQFGVAGLQNQAIGQNYNQGLQSAQFGNTAQQQALAQQLMQYNIPLNQITALMSGSQIQNPQFPGYQGQNVAPPPLSNAAAQQGQWNQGLYNAGVGQANSFNSGLMNMAGSLGSAYMWGR